MIDWIRLLEDARKQQPASIRAVTFRHVLRNASWRPILAECSDGHEYAVKTLGIEHNNLPAGRVLFNEYVAGSLGRLIGAPIPEIALVDLSEEFISDAGLAPRLPGLAYGVRYIPNCQPSAAPATAHCQIFTEWTAWSPADLQYIRQPETGRIYAIDFGNYLGGPDVPRQPPRAPLLRLDLADAANLAALAAFAAVTPMQIAAVVAAPPEDWGISDFERAQVAAWLHDRQQQMIQLNDELTQAWLALADKIYEVGKKIHLASDMITTELGTADPRLTALALLCRTMGHVQGVVGMAQQGFVVEARILTRCCYENLIWMDALAAKGIEFVKEIAGSEIKSKQRRGKVVLDWAARQETPPPFEPSLREHMDKLKKEHPGARTISFKAAADSGVLPDTYMVYGQLSTDAAHPSATTLSRHITRQRVSEMESNVIIEPNPKVRPDELHETLEFACSAFIGVCVGANQILEGTTVGADLNAMCNEIEALREKNKARRRAIAGNPAGTPPPCPSA